MSEHPTPLSTKSENKGIPNNLKGTRPVKI
jgi:hypothetical protein